MVKNCMKIGQTNFSSSGSGIPPSSPPLEETLHRFEITFSSYIFSAVNAEVVSNFYKYIYGLAWKAVVMFELMLCVVA